MTDNEIIKALECCILGDCQGCFYGDTDQRHCKDDLMQNALDLINRQEVEIEELTAAKKTYESIIKKSFLEKAGFDIEPLAEIKSEAYKECIEKVKAEINKHSYGVLHKTVINFKLDNLLKEMAGEING